MGWNGMEWASLFSDRAAYRYRPLVQDFDDTEWVGFVDSEFLQIMEWGRICRITFASVLTFMFDPWHTSSNRDAWWKKSPNIMMASLVFWAGWLSSDH